MSKFINSNLFNDGFETAKKEAAATPVQEGASEQTTTTEKPWRRKGDSNSTEPTTLSKEYTKDSTTSKGRHNNNNRGQDKNAGEPHFYKNSRNNDRQNEKQNDRQQNEKVETVDMSVFDDVKDISSSERKGRYTRDEMLSFYSPYLRPPSTLEQLDKITTRHPLTPASLQNDGPRESLYREHDQEERGKGRGRGGRGRGNNIASNPNTSSGGPSIKKTEYGWGKDENSEKIDEDLWDEPDPNGGWTPDENSILIGEPMDNSNNSRSSKLPMKGTVPQSSPQKSKNNNNNQQKESGGPQNISLTMNNLLSGVGQEGGFVFGSTVQANSLFAGDGGPILGPITSKVVPSTTQSSSDGLIFGPLASTKAQPQQPQPLAGTIFGPLASKSPQTTPQIASDSSSTTTSNLFNNSQQLPQASTLPNGDSSLIFGPTVSTKPQSQPQVATKEERSIIFGPLASASKPSAVLPLTQPVVTQPSPLGEGLVFGPLATPKPTTPISSQIPTGPIFGPSLSTHSTSNSPHVTSSQIPLSTTPHQYFGPLVAPTTFSLPQKLQLPPQSAVNPTANSFLGQSAPIFGPSVSSPSPSAQLTPQQIQQQPKQPESIGPIFGPTLIGKPTSTSTPSSTFSPSPLGEGLILGPKTTSQPKLQQPQLPQQPQQPLPQQQQYQPQQPLPQQQQPYPQQLQQPQQEKESHIDFANRTWCYKVKGTEHGPFPGKQMQVWLDKNYFDINLEVRLTASVNAPSPSSILANCFIKEQRNPFNGMPLNKWFSEPRSCSKFQSELWEIYQSHQKQLKRGSGQNNNINGYNNNNGKNSSNNNSQLPQDNNNNILGGLFGNKSVQPNDTPNLVNTAPSNNGTAGPIFGPVKTLQQQPNNVGNDHNNQSKSKSQSQQQPQAQSSRQYNDPLKNLMWDLSFGANSNASSNSKQAEPVDEHEREMENHFRSKLKNQMHESDGFFASMSALNDNENSNFTSLQDGKRENNKQQQQSHQQQQQRIQQQQQQQQQFQQKQQQQQHQHKQYPQQLHQPQQQHYQQHQHFQQQPQQQQQRRQQPQQQQQLQHYQQQQQHYQQQK